MNSLEAGLSKQRHPVPTGGIRALEAGDESRLQEFFRSHSEETIRNRYGYPVATMSAERARSLVNVDQNRDCALGVFAPDGASLQAVGRYCLDPAGDAAELAFVVHESVRRRGLATLLLRMLIRIARGRGLQLLWALVHAHNTDMLSILRRHHFTLRPDASTGDMLATLDLSTVPSKFPDDHPVA